MHPAVNEIRKAVIGTGKSSIFGGFLSAIGAPRPQGYDDDDNDDHDDDDDDADGRVGCIVARCFDLQKDRSKVFYINIYTGLITQHTQGRKKIHQCSDISNVLVRSDHVVVLDMKRRGHVIQKRFAFHDEESARTYQKYVEFRNDTGIVCVASFDAIDRRGAKLITAGTLKQALRAVDLEVNDEDVKIM
jgi:hypothetical protein